MIVEGPDGAKIDFGDATPDQIKAAMAKHYGGPKAQAPAMGPLPRTTIPTAGNPFGGLVIDNLPSIMGITGGLVGNVPGAAIGGVAGEAARQALREPNIDLGRIGTEGAWQGALGAGGSALSWGSKVAPHAVRGAGKVLGRPLVKELVPGARAASAGLRMAERAKLVNALGNPKFQAALRRSPQAGAALLQGLFYSTDPDASAQR